VGGAIIGHVILHNRSDNDDVDKWLNPLSVATCNSCKHIFVTSKNMLYVIDFDSPLKDMAGNCEFLLLLLALSAIVPRPLWPSG
jgi:hypothetical protein